MKIRFLTYTLVFLWAATAAQATVVSHPIDYTHDGVSLSPTPKPASTTWPPWRTMRRPTAVPGSI